MEGEYCLTDSEIKNMSEATSPKRNGTTRNIAYIFLIIFLIVAIIAIIGGAYFGLTVVRGAKSVTDPVGELIRQLVVEATPVILPNPVVIIEEINSLARLETSSYSFQDILQIERNKDLLFGVFGESLLFVAYGDVIAGVDLAKMESNDLQVASPTKIIVRLPEAEIFLTDLDNDRSYVADRDIGLLTKGDADLETQIRQEAESRMLEASLENGILDRADDEARNFMITFLQQLGFTEIEFSATTLPAITPYVQELPKGFVITPVPLATPMTP
jgi:hypothetical protein